MFETSLNDLQKFSEEESISGTATRLDSRQARAVGLLDWNEHCIECAMPQCYRKCLKYLPRADGKCRRFRYGLVENQGFSGLFPFGIDVRFEPWSKLECMINFIKCAPARIRRIHSMNRSLSRCAFLVSRKLGWFSHGPWNILARVRENLLTEIGKLYEPRFDAFVLECFSAESDTISLRFQCDDQVQVYYSRTFTLKPGLNYFEIPYSAFGLPRSHPGIRLHVYPENDFPARLIFTWLDFVVFNKRVVPLEKPAEKVKCIAWDLDNTLWNGVLIEDGPEGISLRNQALEVIRKLDSRGIIQTIVSKNSHEQAMQVLEKLGIAEYFVYPAINWGAKSENLKQVASMINIGLDTFALVDDSPHERTEVSAQLPMVRVYSDTEIPALPSLSELDVPVTEMSRKRRLSYLAEMKREEIKAKYTDNYSEYLRGLQLQMEIFIPESDEEILRCFELLQRSNQLNLSANRYSENEYKELLNAKDIESYAFRCWDKFGDYGIVGFISIVLGPVPVIRDLVISCRIAQKHYEHALLYWVAQKFNLAGVHRLHAVLVKTGRNTLLASVLKEMGFRSIGETDQSVEHLLDDLESFRDEMIVTTSYRHSRAVARNLS